MMLNHEALAEAVLLGGNQPQGFARAPHGDHREPARLGKSCDLFAGLGIDIDDRACARQQQLAEQAKLLVEIGLEARVIVEMVARDVGEGAGRKPNAIDAALLEPMARRFERKMGDAGLGEIGKDAVKLDGVRRGVREGLRA